MVKLNIGQEPYALPNCFQGYPIVPCSSFIKKENPMENKLELRVGDVVRLKPIVVTTRDDGNGFVGRVQDSLSPYGVTGVASFVESIISRAETDAEKIARLEAENAALCRDLQASEQEPNIFINARGIRPCEPDRKVVVWLRSGEKITQDAGCLRWKLDLEKKDDDVFAYMVLPS